MKVSFKKHVIQSYARYIVKINRLDRSFILERIMMYSVFRIGRMTNCVQRLLKRVRFRLPQQISVLHSKPPVFQTNRCPSSKWTFYDTRSLYTGVHFCSKNEGQKDTGQVSVSRSSHTPPSASAAQKGTCSSENYHSEHSFRQNTIVMVRNRY